MAESLEFALSGQSFERVGFEDIVVAVQVLEDFGLENHVAAIDPAFTDLRLLAEGYDGIAVEIETTESSGRSDGRYRGYAAM